MKKTLSLDGLWHFRPELDVGYHVNNRIPVPFPCRPGADRRHWQLVSVPGCWQEYGARYEIYDGVCWFSRSFTLTEEEARLSGRIHFGAVNYACRVWLNGVEIGNHEGGYTPFTIQCAGALRNGENLLCLLVDNRPERIVWPCVMGYFNYGGIHRSVSLELSDGDAVLDLLWSCTVDGTPSVRVFGKCAPGLDLTLTCAGQRAGITTSAETFEIAIDLPDADLWTPENPALWEAALTVCRESETIQRETHRCGFASVKVENGSLTINGAPLSLRGVCYVVDGEGAGLSMSRERYLQDLTLMKQAGINAVRCHYPMDDVFSDLCDELGLLVWLEPNIYCYHPDETEQNTLFSDPAALAIARRMIEEFVPAARGHVSTAVYGIGNECNTRHPEAEPFFSALAAAVHAADPDRLISYAALYGTVGPVAEAVDVIGINSYWGWYDKLDMAPDEEGWKPDRDPSEREPIDLTPLRTMLQRIIEETNGQKALLLTEFGGDAVPGYFTRSRELWSEDYQADLLRDTIRVSKEYPLICGTFVFCWADYRDPSKDPNGYWDEENLKGIVSRRRNLKMGYNAVAEIYREV